MAWPCCVGWGEQFVRQENLACSVLFENGGDQNILTWLEILSRRRRLLITSRLSPTKKCCWIGPIKLRSKMKMPCGGQRQEQVETSLDSITPLGNVDHVETSAV